jgi:hypothetical protein
VHILNWAITVGGKNSRAGRWGCKGDGGEQADEEGGAEQGEGDHGDAKYLVWGISDGRWELGGSITHRSENSGYGA